MCEILQSMARTLVAIFALVAVSIWSAIAFGQDGPVQRGSTADRSGLWIVAGSAEGLGLGPDSMGPESEVFQAVMQRLSADLTGADGFRRVGPVPPARAARPIAAEMPSRAVLEVRAVRDASAGADLVRASVHLRLEDQSGFLPDRLLPTVLRNRAVPPGCAVPCQRRLAVEAAEDAARAIAGEVRRMIAAEPIWTAYRYRISIAPLPLRVDREIVTVMAEDFAGYRAHRRLSVESDGLVMAYASDAPPPRLERMVRAFMADLGLGVRTFAWHDVNLQVNLSP